MLGHAQNLQQEGLPWPVCAGCGVDGVKVDVQSTVGLVGSRAGGGPALSAAYHASLEQSTRAHFPGNHLINCMCHSTEDLYRWAAPTVVPLVSPALNCEYSTKARGLGCSRSCTAAAFQG